MSKSRNESSADEGPLGNVLVIGDTHIPYEHPGYLSFVKSVQVAYSCQRVVHIGDVTDNHAISYHESDPDLAGAGDEYKTALQHLRKWYRAFPAVKVCIGNHDALPARKGTTGGLPARFIRTMREIWEAPKGWDFAPEHLIDGVMFTHVPIGGNTLTGQLRGAERSMTSLVTGHMHTVAGVAYSAGLRATVFAMATGCGIDRHSPAFAYAQHSKFKPTIGCGVVFEGGQRAMWIPMDLNAYNQKQSFRL